MVVRIGIMHIGKTGGTAVKTAFRDHLKSINKANNERSLKLLPHKWTIKRVTKQNLVDKVVFFIREPADRYVSAFNSRLREGRPRYYSPWSPREKIAFERFKTPNQLAEALNSWNPFKRRAARRAIRTIRHCRLTYAHYLYSVGFLRKQMERIAFIGEQESLSGDFEMLKKLLEAGPDVSLPVDDVKSHKSPVDLDTHLSKRARKNLKKYYKKDYKIYNWCKTQRRQLLAQLEQDAGGTKTE